MRRFFYVPSASPPAWTPNNLTNIVAWYSIPKETGYSDGDNITGLTDWTGRGNGGVQAVSTKQAVYDLTGINNLPSAVFDGTNDIYQLPDSADWDFSTGDFHIFAIVEYLDASTSFITIRLPTENASYAVRKWGFRYVGNTSKADAYSIGGSNTGLANNSWLINTPKQVEYFRESGSVTLEIDSATSTGANTQNHAYTDPIWIGGGQLNTAQTYGKIRLSELVIVKGSMTSEEKTNLDSYFADLYGASIKV